MSKRNTFPTLYEEVKTISISFLIKQGYLKPNQWQKATVSWNRNGYNTGSISIIVNAQTENPYLELDYKVNDKLINYKIKLVPVTSNLGKGIIWYFVCPYTGKRCKKLYLVNNYFYHRSAFKGCMYEKQTYSKKNRSLNKVMGLLFKTDQLIEELNKKHFKKYYAGKPTKKYLKITQRIRKAENVAFRELKKTLYL